MNLKAFHETCKARLAAIEAKMTPEELVAMEDNDLDIEQDAPALKVWQQNWVPNAGIQSDLQELIKREQRDMAEGRAI